MILLEYESEYGESVVIDDDGRHCYAYLKIGEKIVSTVWLYNVEPAPEVPEWTLPNARDLLPFLNPVGYAKAETFLPLQDESEIEIYFGEREGLPQCAIHLRGQYHALLEEGANPGWSRLAEMDSPMARTFDSRPIGSLAAPDQIEDRPV